MRKISRHLSWQLGIVLSCLVPTMGLADNNNFYQSNTQYGVSLPNASLPSGSDEVRAADGTSCRSAVGGDGAYIDTGVIGAPGSNGTETSGAFYTRLVVPLGGKPKRVDCSSLYQLEIQRLKMELDLARMGLTGNSTAPAAAPPTRSNWQTEGWTSEASPNVTPTAAPVDRPKKKSVKSPPKLKLKSM